MTTVRRVPPLIVAVLLLAGCGGASPGPTTAPSATPSASPTATILPPATPTFDSVYFGARAAAQRNGEAIVGAWRLYESGTIDEALLDETLGIFVNEHLGWMDRYGMLMFDHPELDAYHDALGGVLDALADGRDPARAFNRLSDAVEQLAP